MFCVLCAVCCVACVRVCEIEREREKERECVCVYEVTVRSVEKDRVVAEFDLESDF